MGCSARKSGGNIAEQVHPVTGDPLFVAPLTWSHSAFVQTVVEFLKKWNNGVVKKTIPLSA
jgi:GH15 family glucan-1,4-alpha-glucosidase